jgi:arylsulfatase A-like enzyme
MRRLANAVGLLLALALVTQITSCGDSTSSETTRADLPWDETTREIAVGELEPKLSVLLIVIDALRTDALGCYGNERAQTQTLDALANEGILFRSARSSISWTLPAHASLFTSVFPNQHGAIKSTTRLADHFTTLAEVLRDSGWSTAAITDGGFVTSTFGLMQGFDFVSAARPSPGTLGKGAGVRTIANRAWQWIRKQTGPYFAFVHTYQVHEPYAPPERFRQRLVRPYAGELSDAVRVRELRRRQAAGEMTADDLRYVRDLYDAEVAYTDEVLGQFFRKLRDGGQLDSTIVIVTSDHGEDFGEHEHFGHSTWLYETLLSIPLIIRLPRGDGRSRVVDYPVRLVDVAPTVLDLVNLPVPPMWIGTNLLHATESRELLATVTRGKPGAKEESRRELRTAFALVDGQRKIVRYPPRFAGPEDHPDRHIYSIFDLAVDPAELHDLWTPGDSSELDRRFEGALRRFPDLTGGREQQAELSEQDERSLRALGYID